MIITSLPKFLFTPFCLNQTESILLGNRNRKVNSRHFEFDDIDLILDSN